MCTKEKKIINITRACLAVVLALSLMAVNFTPAFASGTTSGNSCDTEYVVQWGDNLYRIGLRFGVSWPEIAANNGIGYPYWVYAGQTICISGPASSSYGSSGVSVFVTKNIIDKNVSIETSSLPKHEIFDVLIGTCSDTALNGKIVGRIKTDGVAGVYDGKYQIPGAFVGVSCLAVRITSQISSRTAYATFLNGSGNYGPVISSTLDFKVNSVVRNKTVNITISNAIKGKKYRVYITRAGHGASGGTYVTYFVPVTNQPFKHTFVIPDVYKGDAKLDLRIQAVTTDFRVYHTFSNVTH